MKRCKHYLIFDIESYKNHNVRRDICKYCKKSVRDLLLANDKEVVKSIKKLNWLKMNVKSIKREV